MSASGSVAALHSDNSLTAAIERKADDPAVHFPGLGLKRLLSPVGDVQFAGNRAK